MARVLPIDLLAEGEKGRVVDIDGHQDVVMRLQEMGLKPGSQIRLIRSGSPCIVLVDERRLSFRTEQSAEIFVEIP